MKVGNFSNDIEVLFRAKHVHACKDNNHLDGIWIYGYLCSKNYIYSDELEGEFLIDENTIGQYVVVKDCDKTKIFTGDIIRDHDMNEYIVSFINGMYILIPTTGLGRKIIGRKQLYELVGYNIKVVGNIYDNPEMFDESYVL